MHYTLTISVFLYFITLFQGLFYDDAPSKKVNSISNEGERATKSLCKDVIGVINPQTNHNENYIFDKSLYLHKVDTLPQIKFWRTIMNLHEDTAILNFASNRQFIQKINMKDWNLKSEPEKKAFRDSVRCCYNLDTTNRIVITAGKKFFYDFDKTSQNFQKGIHCFVENDVDPWFAQAILLIESPNKLQKSNAGAYGSFQLMKDVARLYGLKVNKHIDERANFERSAFAASCLLKKICIPKTRQMLDSLGIRDVHEEELWFRLLVMHVYHAGSYNVQKVLFTINPKEANMDMIYSLWQTSIGRFKSASQNYSQLVLAAMLEMNERTDVANKHGFLVSAR